MTSTQRNLAIAAGVGVIGLLSFTLCCAHGADKAGVVQTPPASSAALQAATAPAEPATVPAAAPQTAPSAEPTALAADPAPQSATARALRAGDEADRNLLADIERQTRTNPPDAIRELLALRRSGATREQLDQFIGQRMTGTSLAVQIAARRWVRAVFEEPGAAPSSPQPVAPALGAGGGQKRVQPVTPATSSKP